jgi:hypothetical protein
MFSRRTLEKGSHVSFRILTGGRGEHPRRSAEAEADATGQLSTGR